MALIKNISKLSDLKVLGRIINGMKTIVAYNKKNYAIDVNLIKGNKIASITETVTKTSGANNIIDITFDNGDRYPIVVKNGSQGDKGKKGDTGDKGNKGLISDGIDYTRSANFLTISNDCTTNDPTLAWSAYRGKVMADKLKTMREIIVDDAEYQLLWNNIVYLDAEFTSTSSNEQVKIFNNDNNDHTVYVKYWTYEESDVATYYIKNPLTNEYEPVIASLWDNIYLGKTSGYFEPTNNQLVDGTVLYYYDVKHNTYNEIELLTRKDAENNDVYVGDKQFDYYSKELGTYIHVSYNNTTKKYTYSLIGEDLDILVYTFNGEKYTKVNASEIDTSNSTVTYYDENHDIISDIAKYIATKTTRCYLKGNSVTTSHAHNGITVESYYTEKEYSKKSDNTYDFSKLPASIDTANFAEYIIVEYNIINNEYTFTHYYGKTQYRKTWYESKSVTFKNGSIILYVYDNNRKYYSSEIKAITDANNNVTYTNVYSEIICPIWLDAVFTTNAEDELTKLINADKELGDEDNTKVDDTAEDVGTTETTVLISDIKLSEEEIVLFNGEPNQLFVKIIPSTATNKILNITYDDSIITFYEDGRIAAIQDNCETEITISTTDGSNISKKVNIILTTPMKKLTLNSNKGTINETNNITVTANYLPANTSDTTVKWEISNPAIASVKTDETTRIATITGIKPGNVEITAIANDGFGASANYKLEVIRPVLKLEWNQENVKYVVPILGTDEETGEQILGDPYYNMVVLLNKEYELIPKITPEDATYTKINWVSSNRQTATITTKVLTVIDTPEVSHEATQQDIDDNKAKELGEIVIDTPEVSHTENHYYVTGIKSGECNITGTTSDGSNLSIVVKLRVDQAVEKITVTPAVLSINIGTCKQLTAELIPVTAVNASYIWKSSNEEIATVNENGLVTAISVGPVDITAEAQDGSGVIGKCNVSVTKPVENINISTSTLYVGIGKSITVITEFLPNEATIKDANWSTSDNNIAIVKDGVVTGVNCGRVTIIAAAKDNSGVIGTCQIVVIKLATAISFEYSEIEIHSNETLALLPIFEPVDTTNETVIWSTSDSNIATINNGGIVNAIKPGEVVITAKTTDGTELSAECKVTIL